MAKRRRIRWDRVLLVFGPLFLLILLIGTRCGHHGGEESSIAENSTAVESMNLTESGADPAAIPAQAQFRDLVVVIDPGHGGDDSGATDAAGKRLEKDDNLRLGLAVEEALNGYPHVQVIMTRETDSFPSLEERCDIANNANADYFISLHRNSATNGKGVEIWINNEAHGDIVMDKLLAEYIMEWLEKVGISNNRGVQKGLRNSHVTAESENFYVNRYTNMPSCLVEMGFMTSAEDNRNFDEKLNEYAEAISGAVMELVTDKGIYQKDKGVPVQPKAET